MAGEQITTQATLGQPAPAAEGAGNGAGGTGQAGTTGQAESTDFASLSDEQILGIQDDTPPAPPAAETTPPAEPAAEEAAAEGEGGAAKPEAAAAGEELPAGAAPPAWLKALYADPNVGRQAQALWDRTAAFSGLFQTVAEAKQFREAVDQVGGIDSLKEAVENAQLADQTDQLFFSGDPQQQSGVVSEMFEHDRDAFESGVVVSLEVIRQRDPERYNKITGEVVSSVMRPEKFDEHIEWLRELATAEQLNPQELSRAVQILVNWADGKGLSGKQKQQALDPRQQQLEQRAQQLERQQDGFRQEQFNSMRETIDQSIRADLGKAISTTLGSLLPKVSEGIRAKIGSEVLAEIDNSLRSDQAITQKFIQLVHPSRTQWNFDRGTQDRVTQLILNRARQMVNGTAKKIVSEWTRNVISANRTTNQKIAGQQKRVDITGGAPPGAGGKPPLTKELVKQKGLSDEEILGY